MKRIVVFSTSTDEPYWSMTLVALHTLYRNGGHWPVYVHLLDAEQRHGDACKRVSPDVQFIEYEKLRKLSPFEVTFSRPRVMMSLLNAGHDQILSLDGDIIVRAEIGKLWEGMDPGTFKIWHKGDKRKPRTRFQGAVYLFGNSPEVREMYADFIERIGKPKGWYDGQEGLYTTWVAHSNRVRRLQLDQKWNDNEFGKHSPIWHAKHSHWDEPRWTAEWQKWKAEVDESLCSVRT